VSVYSSDPVRRGLSGQVSVCSSVVVRRIKSGLVSVCSSGKGPVVDYRPLMD